ncbi:MAG: hypothetical protein GC129_01985 [Proteobacteria bacterium]|nr:hypothetical protein [Pseudomonadota bacterium]
MFGLLDHFSAHGPNARSWFKNSYNLKYWDITTKAVLRPDCENELWLCFPGFLTFDIVLHQAWAAHNLLPMQGHVFLINGPFSLAGLTPDDSIRAMEMLDEVVQKILLQYPNHKLNIFCFSAGTYPGFYFANKYKAARLVALSPGHRMGEGIYSSIFGDFIKKEAVEAGFPTASSYDTVIAPYNQENNLANLPSGANLLIFAARCDLVIRNWGTRKIVNLCKAAGKQPTFKNYNMLDHVSLAMWLGFCNKLGLNPYHIRYQNPATPEPAGDIT